MIGSASFPLRLCSLSLAALSLTILGCSANVPSNSPLAGGQLRGNIHGGQQPVSGASLQLYAAGTTGYGSAATPLLSSPVVSDASGSFTITGDYTCPSSTSQLYIVATGGNPGLAPGTNNSALALMTALGPCSLHGSQYTLDPNAFISINEVTTVASVYALAAFMDGDATHVGTSSTNAIGLANSFQIVNNLVNTTTGATLTVTPAGNGTPPQAAINSAGEHSCVVREFKWNGERVHRVGCCCDAERRDSADRYDPRGLQCRSQPGEQCEHAVWACQCDAAIPADAVVDAE